VTTLTPKIVNVLFLCTNNSAPRIMGETILNALGRGRFKAYSTSSHATGRVNPVAIELLQANHLPIAGLPSKSWDEFAKPGAPFLDFVFTVCDQAAAEMCPVWPGQPMTAHWSVPDPAAVEGSEDVRRKAFFCGVQCAESPHLYFREPTADEARSAGAAEQA